MNTNESVYSQYDKGRTPEEQALTNNLAPPSLKETVLKKIHLTENSHGTQCQTGFFFQTGHTEP